MMQKQKQFERQIKQDIKQSIKSHLPHSKHSKSIVNGIQRRKSTTQNPSYHLPRFQSQRIMKKSLIQIINVQSFLALDKDIKNIGIPEQSSINIKKLGKQPDINIKVIGCMQNINNLSQLWTLKPDRVHLGSYTIHHIQTHLYLKVKGQRVVLSKKQKGTDFLFSIQPKKTSKNLFDDVVFIRPLNSRKSVALKGIMCLVDTNQEDQSQQFYLKQVEIYQPKTLQSAFILSSPIKQNNDLSTLCIGIKQEGQDIKAEMQNMNYSLFQRWTFYPNLQMGLRTNEGFVKNSQEIDRVKQQSPFNGDQLKMRRKQSDSYSQMNELGQKIIKKAASKIVQQIDSSNCYQILNFKINKMLSIKNQGTQIKVILQNTPNLKRQWRVYFDGFSLKIKHQKMNLFLNFNDKQLVLNKNPEYWRFDNFQQK